jgi:hypothetical protein
MARAVVLIGLDWKVRVLLGRSKVGYNISHSMKIVVKKMCNLTANKP